MEPRNDTNLTRREYRLALVLLDYLAGETRRSGRDDAAIRAAIRRLRRVLRHAGTERPH